MRQKKVKAIRGLLGDALSDLPDVAYDDHSQPTYSPIRDSFGFLLGHRKLTRGVPRKLNPNCKKFRFKQLKRIVNSVT